MTQLSLISATRGHVAEQFEHPLHSAISEVRARIPVIRRATGTWLENAAKPVFFLYCAPWRMTHRRDPPSGDEKAVQWSAWDILSEPVGYHAGGGHPGWWVRMTGGPQQVTAMTRRQLKRVVTREPRVPWKLEVTPYLGADPESFDGGHRRSERARLHAYRAHVGSLGAGARFLGLHTKRTKAGRLTAVYAERLTDFILALQFDQVTAHACALAMVCAYRSGDWMTAIDAALVDGKPWAEDLALLSARPESCAIRRALEAIPARE